VHFYSRPLTFQSFIKKHLAEENSHPSFFAVQVGSTDDYYTTDDISTFVKKEIVKIHFETDAQWAYWNGVKQFYDENEGYLLTQVNLLLHVICSPFTLKAARKTLVILTRIVNFTNILRIHFLYEGLFKAKL